ncbi:hypothetical protein AB1Y20_012801 [Prymnesium parvum]|uniref:Uncharacterized protein n=1 Tax=Prymnesium parvum TaxID=97485 RepID=A0AB34IMF4_PRYPA
MAMHCFPRPPLAPLSVAVGSQFGTPQGVNMYRQCGAAPQAPMFVYDSPVAAAPHQWWCWAVQWQCSTVQMQDVNRALREEGEMSSASPCEPSYAVPDSELIELLARAGKKPSAARTRTTANKGQKERQYTIDDLKSMAAAVRSGKATSARASALSAGLPCAERTLNRT